MCEYYKEKCPIFQYPAKMIHFDNEAHCLTGEKFKEVQGHRKALESGIEDGKIKFIEWNADNKHVIVLKKNLVIHVYATPDYELKYILN